MKNYRLLLVFGLAILVWGLHVLALFRPDGFGFDQLSYFPEAAALSWSFLILLLILASWFADRDGLLPRFGSKISLALLGLLWLAALVWLKTSTPLLGDGRDRIWSISRQGYELFRGQPVPLDLLIHWVLYKAALLAGYALIQAQEASYIIASYGAGIIYLGVALVSAFRFFEDRKKRILWLSILLTQGYVQLFAGYAENYSFLPAGLLLWVMSVREAEKGRAWPLVLTQLLLIPLHFFSLLLVPASLYSLWTRPERRARIMAVVLLLLCCIPAMIAMYMVGEYFRGVAIFLAPDKIFTISHLWDFFNHQMLASPTFLILILLVILFGARIKSSKAEKALGAACLIVLLFFFALRPVLGAARDWDLYSFPAMLYTPAALLYLLPRVDQTKKTTARVFLPLLLVSIFHTATWVWLNHSEQRMVSRIKYHIIQESRENRWASSYAFLTICRYYQQKGSVAEALEDCAKSVAIYPELALSHMVYADALWNAGQTLQAISEMETAQEISPRSPEIGYRLSGYYLQYGSELIRKNKIPDAEAYFLKAYELDPRSAPVLQALAQFYNFYLPDPQKAEYYQKLAREQK